MRVGGLVFERFDTGRSPGQSVAGSKAVSEAPQFCNLHLDLSPPKYRMEIHQCHTIVDSQSVCYNVILLLRHWDQRQSIVRTRIWNFQAGWGWRSTISC